MYTHGFTLRVASYNVHPAYIRREIDMHTTRVFRNGNSQAVRIPADLAYERSDIELEIERVGDEIRIRPMRRPLTQVLEKFAKFGPDFMTEGRGDHEQAEREGW